MQRLSYSVHTLNWDNLRYVLSVIETGSVSAAARELGVNHATVLRRIATFEQDYGGVVFEKSVNGYKVLPQHEQLVQAVREVENSVLSVHRLMQGSNVSLHGVVRISSTDTICTFLLPEVLAPLQQEAPEIDLQLLSSNSHIDFARMEADIFVRPALSLPPHMIGEKATNLIFRAYGTQGCPEVWYDLKGPLAKSDAARWLRQTVPPEMIVSGSDSFLVLQRLAKMGLGISILPSFVGDQTEGLVQLEGKMPDIRVPIWVGTHEDLRDTPRIRAVRKHIAGALHAGEDA